MRLPRHILAISFAAFWTVAAYAQNFSPSRFIETSIRKYDWRHPTGKPAIDTVLTRDIPQKILFLDSKCREMLAAIETKLGPIDPRRCLLIGKKYEFMGELRKADRIYRKIVLKSLEVTRHMCRTVLKLSRQAVRYFSNRQAQVKLLN